MVSGITSCPSFAMATSRPLVRCGELWCELEAGILELIHAMAKLPLLFFWLSFFDSCLVHSFPAQLGQVRHRKHNKTFSYIFVAFP